MRAFTLVVPHDLKEAAEAGRNKTAVFKAAGIDLLDRLKERVESPGEVVNLLALRRELSAITADGPAVKIGALVTLSQLEADAALKDRAFAALREAAGEAATPQVRNRATVAGNLLQKTRCWYLRSAAFGCLHDGKGPSCLAMTGENRYHAVLGVHDCARVHPSNLAPALFALGAEVEVLRADGKQAWMPIAQLYPAEPKAQAPEHTLQQGEILTAVRVPAQPPGSRSAYSESREKLSFDWATSAAAVRVVVDGSVMKDATICLGGVAPVPLLRPDAAKLLVGQKPADELFQRVADAAYQGAVPLSQNAYKLQVGRATLREALHHATK